MQTVAGNSNYSRCLFRWKQMHNISMSFHKKSNSNGKECFLKRSYFHLLGRHTLCKKHFTLNIELLTSERLMFGIATKTKITRGKPTWKFFVFRLRSFHPLEGWEKTKNSKKPKENKKNKETKKNKVLGEMLCPRVSSRGLFFFGFFVFFGFSGFFGFLRVFLVFDLWICVAFLRDKNQDQHILVLQ